MRTRVAIAALLLAVGSYFGWGEFDGRGRLWAQSGKGAAPGSTAKPPEILWERRFGGKEGDRASSILALSDGGFFVVGTTGSKGAGGTDAWLLRLDATGKLLWDRTYGGKIDDSARSIVALPDGDYVILGRTDLQHEFSTSRNDWLLRIDKQGKVRWKRAFGGPYDEAASIVMLPDRGFAVVGETGGRLRSGRYTATKAWVIRLTSGGKMLWQRTFDSKGNSKARSIVALGDGGFVVLADFKPPMPGWGDGGWLLRLDRDGKLLRKRIYDGKKAHFYFSSIVTLPDGGFAIAGVLWKKEQDGLLLRLDGEGKVLWRRTYGGKAGDWPKAMVALPDGGFAIAGTTRNNSAGLNDGWLLRVDAAGNLLWDRTFGGGDSDDALAIVALPDGGFAVAGHAWSKSAGLNDVWVVRFGGRAK